MIKIAENTQTGTIDLPLSLTMDVITHLNVDDNPEFYPYNSTEAEKMRKVLTIPARELRHKLWRSSEIDKWKRDNSKEATKYIIEGFDDEYLQNDDDFDMYDIEVCGILYNIFKYIYSII